MFAGVDIETTGTDPDKGHRLIQIGFAFEDGFEHVEDVRPVGEMTVDPEALNINKFTLTRIDQGWPTNYTDVYLHSLLHKRGYSYNSLIPVGYNVGGFDMVFVKKELPHTAKFFTCRCVDLTAFSFLESVRSNLTREESKERMHKITVNKLGVDNRHDALFDAKAALIHFNYYKEHGL